jgi:hypothetical protein
VLARGLGFAQLAARDALRFRYPLQHHEHLTPDATELK